jgi:hypothetical protein
MRVRNSPKLFNSGPAGETEMSIFTRRALMLSGVGAAAAFVSPAEAATGSIALRIASAGFFVGVTGGSGTLNFRHGRYPLTVGGISAGALVGLSEADLSGTAFHLREPRDIEGVYTAVATGLAVATGRQFARMTNARGVSLRLRGAEVGLSFSLDLSGMSISLA